MTVPVTGVIDQVVQLPRRGKEPLDGYLAMPEGATVTPAVIIIHELFGLNDNIREISRRFAVEGYTALAVDLFSGGNRALCMVRVMGGLLLRPLKNQALRDLRRSVDWLQAQPAVDRQRIGVAGFCMGGGYALALACVEGDLRAAAPFYGQNPRPLSAVARACPIVGSYPSDDRLTRGAAVKLDQALTRYEIPHDIRVYPGAQHSFFNDRLGAYHPEAAADAWQRLLSFFAEHVGGRPPSDS